MHMYLFPSTIRTLLNRILVVVKLEVLIFNYTGQEIKFRPAVRHTLFGSYFFGIDLNTDLV